MDYKFDGDKVFFTSDTHFNHTNIIQYCQRPFKSTDEMNEAMIDNWNSVVGEDDTVFHLGDFCLGGAAEWNKILNRLNGKIYLILGNHDLKNIRQGFIERFKTRCNGNAHRDWEKENLSKPLSYLCFEGGYKDDVWQLFGHVHTRSSNTGIDAGRLQYLYPTQLDVGVDNNNFTPLSFEQARAKILKQLQASK